MGSLSREPDSGLIITNHSTLALPAVDIRGESLTLDSDGNGYVGAIHAIDTNSWSGPILLHRDARLALSGIDARLTLSGPIQGSSGLVVEDRGTLRLEGSQPNTFTGVLVCNGGVTELFKPTALAISSDIQVNIGALRLLASHQILDAASLSLDLLGRFEMNAFSEVIGDLTGLGKSTWAAVCSRLLAAARWMYSTETSVAQVGNSTS